MPLTRIKINDTAVDAGAYTFILNPSVLDIPDSTEHTLKRTLDGGQISQQIYFDSRPIIMSWTRIPSDFSGFGTFIGVLNGYVGSTKYINYGDVDYRASATTWNKVVVVDLEVKVEPGGKLRKNVTMTLTPEPE